MRDVSEEVEQAAKLRQDGCTGKIVVVIFKTVSQFQCPAPYYALLKFCVLYCRTSRCNSCIDSDRLYVISVLIGPCFTDLSRNRGMP